MASSLEKWLRKTHPEVMKQWEVFMGGHNPVRVVDINNYMSDPEYISSVQEVVDDVTWYFADDKVYVDLYELCELADFYEDDLEDDTVDADTLDLVFISSESRDWSLTKGFHILSDQPKKKK